MEMRRGPVGGGVWVRETIPDGHGARWTVDAWLVPRGHRLVVGEVRVFPAAGAAEPGAPWELAPTKVPRRGLERRLLREVPIGRYAPYILAELSRSVAAERRVEALTGQPASIGLGAVMFGLVPDAAALVPRPRPRRNVGRDDRFYAELAAEYVGRISQGSTSPVKDIAGRRPGETPAHVRDMLHEARARGLLTKGTPGTSVGALTSRALAVLGKGDAKTRPQRRRRPRR